MQMITNLHHAAHSTEDLEVLGLRTQEWKPFKEGNHVLEEDLQRSDLELHGLIRSIWPHRSSAEQCRKEMDELSSITVLTN